MEAIEQLVLGAVSARRELHYSHPEHGTRSLQVLLGAPVESLEDGAWHCPWRIVGIGGDQVRSAYGVDSFQCLQVGYEDDRGELVCPEYRW